VDWGGHYADPCVLRLIRNAAALAAARPTLSSSTTGRMPRLNRNDSDEFCCDGIPVAVKCASVSLAGGCRDYGGEKRNILIVSVLLPMGVHFTLRSNTQRAIKVLWM
jgi:hypothetical protein